MASSDRFPFNMKCYSEGPHQLTAYCLGLTVSLSGTPLLAIFCSISLYLGRKPNNHPCSIPPCKAHLMIYTWSYVEQHQAHPQWEYQGFNVCLRAVRAVVVKNTTGHSFSSLLIRKGSIHYSSESYCICYKSMYISVTCT